MSKSVLKPYTSAECTKWAAWHAEQARFYESRGRHREAEDSRRWSSSWARSAAIAAQKEGALW